MFTKGDNDVRSCAGWIAHRCSRLNLEDLLDTSLNPLILPVVGSRISFWDVKTNKMLTAHVTKMHPSEAIKWPLWWNVKIEQTGKEMSINLDLVCNNCVSWRYANIQQIDGNYTDYSLSSRDESNLTPENALPEVPNKSSQTLTDEQLSKEYSSNPINLKVTIQYRRSGNLRFTPPPPLNLKLLPNEKINPNKVYILPDLQPSDTHQKQEQGQQTGSREESANSERKRGSARTLL